MQEQLKPCPFCGGVPRALMTDSVFVYCPYCGGRTMMCTDMKTAVEVWNKRHDSSTLEKEADWLASLLPMSEHDDNAEEAIYRWREAARKAVEEPCGK